MGWQCVGQKEFDLWPRCTDPYWCSPLFDVLIRFTTLCWLALWAVQIVFPCTDFLWGELSLGAPDLPHVVGWGDKCPSSTSFPCAGCGTRFHSLCSRGYFYSPSCLEFMGYGHRATSRHFHVEKSPNVEEVCEILKLMNSWWKDEGAGQRFWNLNFPAPLGPQA